MKQPPEARRDRQDLVVQLALAVVLAQQDLRARPALRAVADLPALRAARALLALNHQV